MSLKTRLAFKVAADLGPLTTRDLAILDATCNNFAEEIVKQAGFTFEVDSDEPKKEILPTTQPKPPMVS